MFSPAQRFPETPFMAAVHDEDGNSFPLKPELIGTTHLEIGGYH
jgi:hypothetical protein